MNDTIIFSEQIYQLTPILFENNNYIISLLPIIQL